jgi:hypothetical protein
MSTGAPDSVTLSDALTSLAAHTTPPRPGTSLHFVDDVTSGVSRKL